MRTRFRNALILTQNAQRAIIAGCVDIEDDRIIAVTANDQNSAHSIDSFDRVVECDGRFLLPGFVQTHVHLCQTHLRNCADDRELLPWLREFVWPGEAAHTRDSLYATARLAISELLQGGTTTVLTMETAKYTEAAFEAAIDGGIRAIIGKALMDRAVGQPPELYESTTDALRDADELFQKYHHAASGRIDACYAPRFVPTCTPALWEGVVSRANEREALLHTHACENRDELTLVRKLTGMENLEYLESVGALNERACIAHCVHLSDQDVERLRATQTNVLHCPLANLKLGSGIAPISALIDAGVRVSIGADGAACNNNLDALQEARLMSLLQSVSVKPGAVSAQQAFDAMTIHGARALQLEHEIGSIEVGKKADLVVLDPTQPHSQGGNDSIARLIYSCRSSDVKSVFVDGQQVV